MKLAIDPGIRGSGLAALSPEGVLAFATYVRNPAKAGHSIREAVQMAAELEAVTRALLRDLPVGEVVVEKMQVRLNSPGNPNVSLLPLVGVAYAFAARFPAAEHAEFDMPRDWKGTVDAIEVTRRVRERLTPHEFSRVQLPASACQECRKHFGAYCQKGERGCGADHVYDAIGIGLKHCGRFERKRVIPR
jgi:hypothetical protein